MKGFEMYMKIKQLKELGFSRSQVAKQLEINRETVTRYWDMEVNEYEQRLNQNNRIQLLDKRRDIILKWLEEYPTLTSAQITDWLMEKYQENFKERTVSRYVRRLRERYNMKKSNKPREYEAVEDLPPGQQMQVDFGEKYIKNTDGKYIKQYFVAFVLSHSRYKWGYFQKRPFTAVDLVNACKKCFRFFTGQPQELVFDQDSIVTVSENRGDIIHTYEFEKFRNEYGFKIFLCRKADPETKGKIESVVKFIKGNFMENRIYPNDEGLFNSLFVDWLERTGNGKIHSTTKKIPTVEFENERNFLLRLPVEEGSSAQILRTVRKDNTIIYDSNRYSVPLGTYGTHREVLIEATESILTIKDIFGDYTICEHQITTGRGLLIKNTTHGRDRTTRLDEIHATLDEMLGYKATEFLTKIRQTKSRYARDQFSLIKKLIHDNSVEAVILAIEFCVENRLYSANYVNDFVQNANITVDTTPLKVIPISDKKYHVTTQKRDVSVYSKAGEQI